MAAAYVKPTRKHNAAARLIRRARMPIVSLILLMENFANVVYTSREFNLSNRLFEDPPGFGEFQRIFVRSAYACVSSIYCNIVQNRRC